MQMKTDTGIILATGITSANRNRLVMETIEADEF